jgi:hypothetical protein
MRLQPLLVAAVMAIPIVGFAQHGDLTYQHPAAPSASTSVYSRQPLVTTDLDARRLRAL